MNGSKKNAAYKEKGGKHFAELHNFTWQLIFYDAISNSLLITQIFFFPSFFLTIQCAKRGGIMRSD